MGTDTLEAYIKKVSDRIPEKDIPLLAGCAQSMQLAKGDVLLKEGDICRTFYLVEKGYLRTYYNKDGIDINLNFALEGNFTTNLKSLNSREPSELIIEAGEDSAVWFFNIDKIVAEYGRPQEFTTFIRRLAIHILLLAEEHSNLFKLYTPAERYKYIEAHNPQLLQRVSLSQISSYLGVARETLSRIRAKKH